jgi:hypothetical protein
MGGSSGAESMPPSLDRFLAELRLIHPGYAHELVGRLARGQGPPDVARVAHEMVRIKALTPYQAAALYQSETSAELQNNCRNAGIATHRISVVYAD